MLPYNIQEVSEILNSKNFSLISTEYKNLETPLEIRCPKGCIFTKTLNAFLKIPKCNICQKTKIKTKIIDSIQKTKFLLNDNLDSYKNQFSNINLICPNGHKFISNSQKIFKKIVCPVCKPHYKRFTHQYVVDYLESYNYTTSSIYKSSKTDMIITCPNNHTFKKKFVYFKKGSRCMECHIENNMCGENNPQYNPSREEVKLNKRIRSTRSFKWVKDNMSHDPNYEDYLVNQKNYHVDHIIPISIFGKIVQHYNLDESIIKKIINSKDNIQILKKEDNLKKYIQGSLFEACQFLMLHGVQLS